MNITNINEQIKAAITAHQATDMRLAQLAMLALATMARDKWPTASYIVLTPTDQDDSGDLWVQGVFDSDSNLLADSERFDGWRTPVAYHLHEANEVVWQPYVTVPEPAPSYGEYHLDIDKVLNGHGVNETAGECECKTGYVLDQTYGFADIPEGWTPVQAHDVCERFEGDAEAAAHAAHDKGTVAQYFFAEQDEDNPDEFVPGDYAIHWVGPTNTPARSMFTAD